MTQSPTIARIHAALDELAAAFAAAVQAAEQPALRASLLRMESNVHRFIVRAGFLEAAGSTPPATGTDSAKPFDTRAGMRAVRPFESSRLDRMKRFYAPDADKESIAEAESGRVPEGDVVGMGAVPPEPPAHPVPPSSAESDADGSREG